MSEGGYGRGILDFLARKNLQSAALRLAELRGGIRIYVPNPENLSPEHWLMRELGPVAAAHLSQEYGGQHVEVPLGPHSGSRNRTWRAMEDGLRYGWSVAETAMAAGVTRRTVQRSWHKRKNNNQLNLFGGYDYD